MIDTGETSKAFGAGLRARLARGLAAQGFGQALNLAIQMTSVPLFMGAWGGEKYGEWLLLSTIPSYLALSDFGFSDAAGTEMTIRMARDDKGGALEAFQSAWLLISCVSAASAVLGIVAIAHLPIDRWLNLSSLSRGEVEVACALLLAQVAVGLQGGLLAAGYRCDGRFAEGVMAANLLRGAEFLAAVSALVVGGGVCAVASAVLLARLFGLGLTWVDLRRRSPWIAPGIVHARVATLRKISVPAFSSLLLAVGGAVGTQGLIMVIGVVLGPVAVTEFSTLRTLSRVVRQVQLAIARAVVVEMSTAFGTGDIGRARVLHRSSSQVALWATIALSAPLILFGDQFYAVWTRGRIAFDPGLFRILLASLVFSSLWTTSLIVSEALNRHRNSAFVFVAKTAQAVVLGWLAASTFGLRGIATSLLLSEVVMTAFVMNEAVVMVGDRLFSHLNAIVVPPVRWLRSLAGDRDPLG